MMRRPYKTCFLRAPRGVVRAADGVRIEVYREFKLLKLSALLEQTQFFGVFGRDGSRSRTEQVIYIVLGILVLRCCRM